MILSRLQCKSNSILRSLRSNLPLPTLPLSLSRSPRPSAVPYSSNNNPGGLWQEEGEEKEKHLASPGPSPIAAIPFTPVISYSQVAEWLVDKGGKDIPWALLVDTVLPESLGDSQTPPPSDLADLIVRLIRNGLWDRAALLFDTLAGSRLELYEGGAIARFAEAAFQSQDSDALIGLTSRFVADYSKGHQELGKRPPAVTADDLVTVVSVLLRNGSWEWALVLFDAALTRSRNLFRPSHILLLCSHALRWANMKALRRFLEELFSTIGKKAGDSLTFDVNAFRRMLLYTMEFYFSHEKYIDVLDVYNHMLDSGVPGDSRIFLVVLQSRMRLHRPVHLVGESLGRSATQLSYDAVKILSEMAARGVDIGVFHRAVILNGYLSALLAESSKGRLDLYRALVLLQDMKEELGNAQDRHLKFQRKSWAEIDPPLKGLTGPSSGDVLDLAWAEATQKVIKFYLTPARLGERESPEMLQQLSHWHDKVLERLPSLDPSVSSRTIPELLRDAQLSLICMRSHLFQNEFDRGFEILERIHSIFDLVVTRSESIEPTHALLVSLNDITTRFASALIGFVSAVLAVQDLSSALAALQMSATLKDMQSFCRLWRRLFGLQWSLDVGWEGDTGLGRSLELFSKQLDAYNAGRQAERRRSGYHKRWNVGGLGVMLHYDIVLQHVTRAAWPDRASLQAGSADLSGDAEQKARLGLVADVHWQCGIMLTDESWFPASPGYSAHAFAELRRLYEEVTFTTRRKTVPGHDWPLFRWEDTLRPLHVDVDEQLAADCAGGDRWARPRTKGNVPSNFIFDASR